MWLNGDGSAGNLDSVFWLPTTFCNAQNMILLPLIVFFIAFLVDRTLMNSFDRYTILCDWDAALHGVGTIQSLSTIGCWPA